MRRSVLDKIARELGGRLSAPDGTERGDSLAELDQEEEPGHPPLARSGALVQSGHELGRWWCAIHHDRGIGWGDGSTPAAAVRVCLWRLYWAVFHAEPMGAELSAAELSELQWLLGPGPRA